MFLGGEDAADDGDDRALQSVDLCADVAPLEASVDLLGRPMTALVQERQQEGARRLLAHGHGRWSLGQIPI